MGESEPPDLLLPADSVLRNAGFSLAAQLVTSVFTAGLTLFLARALGAETYGLFALAVGLSTLIILPVDFGVAASAGRFLADHRGDLLAVRALLADALGLKLLLTVPACIGLAALARPIALAYGSPELTWPLRGVSLAVFGQSLLLLYTAAFTSLGRIRSQLRVQVFESVSETATTVVLVLLGGGASGAAFGRGIGYLVGGIFAVVATIRLLGPAVLPRRLRGTGRIRAISGYAWPLLIVNAAFTLFEQIDILIIGAVGSVMDVGLFQMPMRLSTFLQYPSAALAYAVAPRVVGADASKARERLQPCLRGLVLGYALLLAPLLVWAEPIIGLLLGGGYAGSAPVLRALAPFVFLLGVAPLVSLVLGYIGQARARVPITLATVAVNVAIDIVLIPRIGIVGGALGTDVAFSVYVLAHLWICRRHFPIDLPALARTFARALAAAAAMAAVMAFAGTSQLSLADWVLGAAGGLLAYAGVLVLTREVGIHDLRDLRALRGRRSGPGSTS